MFFNFTAIFQFVTTAMTFVQGVVDQVAPVVSKFLTGRQAVARNAYCDMPYCAQAPNHCPREQLAQVCLQHERQQIERQATRQLTTLTLPRQLSTTSPLKNEDENDGDSKDKSSTSGGSAATLAIVGVIVLAIAGFLYVRCTRRSTGTGTLEERKSSSWDV